VIWKYFGIYAYLMKQFAELPNLVKLSVSVVVSTVGVIAQGWVKSTNIIDFQKHLLSVEH
jgi:hypothetical protein